MDEDEFEELAEEGKRSGRGGDEFFEEDEWDWWDVVDGIGFEDLEGDFGWEDVVGFLIPGV